MTNVQELNQAFDALVRQFGPWLIPLNLWSLAWKGVALWRAAQLRHKVWFIVILIVNTVGILEILYLWVFSKTKLKPQNTK